MGAWLPVAKVVHEDEQDIGLLSGTSLRHHRKPNEQDASGEQGCGDPVTMCWLCVCVHAVGLKTVNAADPRRAVVALIHEGPFIASLLAVIAPICPCRVATTA